MSLRGKLRRLPEIIRASALQFASEMLDLRVSLGTEDRRLLEQIILPELGRREALRRVLFVGCDWYTRRYADFFARREYWTLEADPGRARYGTSARHVVGVLSGIGARFPPGSLDLIVANGVLGWGLDDREEAERSWEACFEALRPGGLLLVGFNDIPEKRVYPLEQSEALKRFNPHVFGPLGSDRYGTGTANRHTFLFFEKPAA